MQLFKHQPLKISICLNDRCISTWAAQENTCPLQGSQHRWTVYDSVCWSSSFCEGVKCALVDLVSTVPVEI